MMTNEITSLFYEATGIKLEVVKKSKDIDHYIKTFTNKVEEALPKTNNYLPSRNLNQIR